MDDAIDCLMSFPDFLYAFQLQFYYQGIKKHNNGQLVELCYQKAVLIPYNDCPNIHLHIIGIVVCLIADKAK